MLGSIIGDIAGSVYEFNNYRAKDFTPFFHPQGAFTDDTVCTVAIADSLVHDKCPARTLKEWGERYLSNGGWGRSFALWLGSDSLEPYGSYGNGAAMRVAPAGLLATSLGQAQSLTMKVTEVTHNHPEGIRGAVATASSVYLARAGMPANEIRQYVTEEFGYDLSRCVDDIRPGYVFNETCQRSVPEALTCVFEATSFEDAIRNAISIGGDSDTIAAIAGGVAEAMFGIPDDIATEAWVKLPVDMKKILTCSSRDLI